MLAARNSLRRKPGPRNLGLAMPAIAQAVHTLYRIKAGIERAELAADALDVRRNGAVVYRQAGFPHQRVTVLDMAGEFSERMYNPEFGQGQFHLCAAQCASMRLMFSRRRPRSSTSSAAGGEPMTSMRRNSAAMRASKCG